MRRFVILASAASIACGAPGGDSTPGAQGAQGTQGISGTIQNAAGPVGGAIVRLQHFPTTACRDLSSARTLTPAQQDEFAKCASNLAPDTTDGSGAYRVDGIAPGWYSMNVRWTIDQKPAVAEPNTIVDGFLIIYMETRRMPPQYVLSALDTAAFEVKAGQQAVRNFTFRP
jgi:hypothetical protein